jgi:hypothetical protein
MNPKLARQYDIVKLYRQLRNDLTNELTDGGLRYSPGGDNAPLGVLCRKLEEVQKGYIESFKTFNVDFSYASDDESVETSIESIHAWFQQLDQELEDLLESLTDSDVDERLVFRSEEFKLPPVIHLDVF